MWYLASPLACALCATLGFVLYKSLCLGLYLRMDQSAYCSTQFVVTCCFRLCSFFTDTRYFWLGCTEFPPCNYEVSRGLRLLYALELGYYVQVS